jgi:hypothetical protein
MVRLRLCTVGRGLTTLLATMAATLAVTSQGYAQESPATISTSLGAHNVDHLAHQATELRVEMQPSYRIGILRPVAAVGLTMHGTSFLGAGLSSDIRLGSRAVVTPSFLANAYSQGSSGHSLGHALEFRSQALVAYRFDDDSRVGIAISHFSNAGLGRRNPGSESLSVYYTVPMSRGTGNDGGLRPGWDRRPPGP